VLLSRDGTLISVLWGFGLARCRGKLLFFKYPEAGKTQYWGFRSPARHHDSIGTEASDVLLIGSFWCMFMPSFTGPNGVEVVQDGFFVENVGRIA
jgi:hypothetical protein